MPLPFNFDWRNPDYVAVFDHRTAVLKQIRSDKKLLDLMLAHYRYGPDGTADFISDWGITYDPRNAERDLPTVIPFVLFEKQREWVNWVIAKWKAQQPGMTEKSRDEGVSWLAVATACTLCLHNEGLAIGFGSRLVDYVDKIGTMKPLLPKARMFMENLPEEFRGGYVPWRDSPYMRLNFPETGSLIMGEGGDQIGRGDRASIYVVDEAAYLDRPELVDQALSQTTNCRIDVSSVRANTLFAKKRHEGKIDVFVFDWHDDPRKDQAWYDLLSAPADQGGKGLDPVTIAQEVDRDYSASVEGIIIPAPWVRASLDALENLGIAPTGLRRLAYDVADEGVDKNAVAGREGVQIDLLQEWSGKGSDLFASTQWVFNICDEHGYDVFRYDADGMGANVRGDARIINEERRLSGVRQIRIEAFRGSDAVYLPEGEVDGTIGSDGSKGRLNQDYFANRKAQGWYSLARRFYRTYKWVVQGVVCAPDDIISIKTKGNPLWPKLVTELSQPTRTFNKAGKLLIDKKPNGLKSPNLADCVMIDFAETEQALNITAEMIAEIQRAGYGGAGRRPRR